MNHCVVFRQIGGHAYGGVYPGPMGAVLTPAFMGLDKSRELAHACTMNGRCQEVCPVAIPLPALLRGWRDRSWREGLEPGTVRFGIGLWAFVARRPALYRLASRYGRARDAAVRAARLDQQRCRLAGGWTGHRDLPAPPGKTFMELHRARRPDTGESIVTQTRDRILGAIRAGLGGPLPHSRTSPPRRWRCWPNPS